MDVGVRGVSRNPSPVDAEGQLCIQPGGLPLTMPPWGSVFSSLKWVQGVPSLEHLEGEDA